MKSAKMKKVFNGLVAATAATAVIGGAGLGVHALQNTMPSVEDGTTYLENNGFTHVEPTDQSYPLFEVGCKRGEQRRTYNVTDKDGKEAEKVLCVGLFHRMRQL